MANFITKLFNSKEVDKTDLARKYEESLMTSNVRQKSISEELMELYIPFGRILPFYQTRYSTHMRKKGYYFSDKDYNRDPIVVELDNQYFFNDGSPTIGNPTMSGYNKPFMLSVGIDNIETTKIKRVLLFIDVYKDVDNIYRFKIDSDIEIERTAHCVVYGGQTTISLSELLSNDISLSDSFYELSIGEFRAYRTYPDINGLNYFLREIKEKVKNIIISHFKTEVTSLRKYVSERKNRIQFEETLNIDKVKECFIELFDNNSNEILKTEGNDYYYFINIPVDFLKLPKSNNSISLNDEATELLFNISEGTNRIKGIYDCCVNMSFDFNHNGNINEFKIYIKPIEF